MYNRDQVPRARAKRNRQTNPNSRMNIRRRDAEELETVLVDADNIAGRLISRRKAAQRRLKVLQAAEEHNREFFARKNQ